MKLIIVSGLSGSGKSIALETLEDCGFYCIDNLPITMLEDFINHVMLIDKNTYAKTAIGIDARNQSESLVNFTDSLRLIRSKGIDCEIIFMQAEESTLLKRYSETRRKHPLIDEYNGSLLDAIEAERIILQPARQIADYIIDTSNLTATECKERVSSMFIDNPTNAMTIHCISFGFKYGIPSDSDLVFDVRCLPNPFYIDELKEHTGIEMPVRDFVMKWDQAKILIQKLYDLIDFLIPLYRAEGKSQLVISIGCTGGRHRSVVFAELIREHLCEDGLLLSINHRDIKK